MRWEGNRQSDNIEDRRGMGGGGFGLGGGGLKIGTVIIALIASYFLGINPMTVMNILGGVQSMAPQAQVEGARPQGNSQDRGTAFVRTVVADTEDVWGKIFANSGQRYPAPTLVLYEGSTPSACGMGQAAMGPFYCPGDQKVYLDMEFFRTLETRLNSPGDFAKAYVIAHEVGHHIQNLQGTTDKVDSLRGRVNQATQNAASVALELQADCYAGVWGHHAHNQRQILENGDIEAAMNAAAQIGDDALQRKSQGYVVPDSFTHGSSAQRVAWFKRGLQTGDINQCNTFK